MARTAPPPPPAAPPATAEAGAAFVRDFVVKLYDRQDGKGVDWQTIAGTLFRASFDVLAELPPKQKQAFADRVHQRSYEAMTDDPAPGNSSSPAAEPEPSNTIAVPARQSRP